MSKEKITPQRVVEVVGFFQIGLINACAILTKSAMQHRMHGWMQSRMVNAAVRAAVNSLSEPNPVTPDDKLSRFTDAGMIPNTGEITPRQAANIAYLFQLGLVDAFLENPSEDVAWDNSKRYDMAMAAVDAVIDDCRTPDRQVFVEDGYLGAGEEEVGRFKRLIPIRVEQGPVEQVTVGIQSFIDGEDFPWEGFPYVEQREFFLITLYGEGMRGKAIRDKIREAGFKPVGFNELVSLDEYRDEIRGDYKFEQIVALGSNWLGKSGLANEEKWYVPMITLGRDHSQVGHWEFEEDIYKNLYGVRFLVERL